MRGDELHDFRRAFQRSGDGEIRVDGEPCATPFLNSQPTNNDVRNACSVRNWLTSQAACKGSFIAVLCAWQSCQKHGAQQPLLPTAVRPELPNRRPPVARFVSRHHTKRRRLPSFLDEKPGPAPQRARPTQSHWLRRNRARSAARRLCSRWTCWYFIAHRPQVQMNRGRCLCYLSSFFFFCGSNTASISPTSTAWAAVKNVLRSVYLAI
jgi:hypothetical protein